MMAFFYRIAVTSLFLLAATYGYAAQVSTPSHLDKDTVSSGTSQTGASISPTGNALIVVGIVWRATSGSVDLGATPISSTFSTGGWNHVATTTAVGSSNVRASIFWAQADSSPGSGAVTVSYASTVDRGVFYVAEMASNFDTTTPIAQNGSDTDGASGTTVGGAFGATPDANSILFAVSGGGDELAAHTEDTGWTELNETFNMTSSSQYADGGNGTSFGVTFGTTITGGMAILAVEVQEVQSAGASIPVLHHQLRNQ